jgi:3-polyprenyl-4-hydroxybenzoate decarboxylase
MQVLVSLVNPTHGIPALMSARGTEHNTEKPTTAGELASCFHESLNCHKSTSKQEHMDQLLKALRSSRMASQEPHQLYLPGRIMHMVELPAAETYPNHW